MRLSCRDFEFHFPRSALVMGVVNVTPDSFSDGGRYFEPDAAVARALELEKQGAGMIDIGGESTRPQSRPVEEEEESRRVVPVIERLAGRIAVPISIDTRKPGVARKAIRAGASVINDIGANRNDPEMWAVAAETGAGYVCMHMQGTPETMQANPTYADVIREVGEFFSERLEQLSRCGVRQEQVILDPGIGFGKTVAHNLQLLAALGEFGRWERPLLLGVSRKSFMGRLLGLQTGERLPAALACTCLAVAAGVQMVRAHDVAETVQALRMTEAILAKQQV